MYCWSLAVSPDATKLAGGNVWPELAWPEAQPASAMALAPRARVILDMCRARIDRSSCQPTHLPRSAPDAERAQIWVFYGVEEVKLALVTMRHLPLSRSGTRVAAGVNPRRRPPFRAPGDGPGRTGGWPRGRRPPRGRRRRGRRPRRAGS